MGLSPAAMKRLHLQRDYMVCVTVAQRGCMPKPCAQTAHPGVGTGLADGAPVQWMKMNVLIVEEKGIEDSSCMLSRGVAQLVAMPADARIEFVVPTYELARSMTVARELVDAAVAEGTVLSAARPVFGAAFMCLLVLGLQSLSAVVMFALAIFGQHYWSKQQTFVTKQLPELVRLKRRWDKAYGRALDMYADVSIIALHEAHAKDAACMHAECIAVSAANKMVEDMGLRVNVCKYFVL